MLEQRGLARAAIDKSCAPPMLGKKDRLVTDDSDY
jgi:hypothetical protein